VSAITEFYERRNLERAWRWIRSNPDAGYKRFSGPQYSRFAVADDLIIDDLQDRLRRGIYEPRHASKLLIPKRSGILRPYTILTVEDQIVYQGLINVVAERLATRIRSRYFSQVFGHMYAGTASQWFYKRWNDGYTAFNKAARAAVKGGQVYSASFDLTACYDSLDHSVLCHFLMKLRCEREFCDFLNRCLSRWTATHERIYQNHGIPQGPLASGLLSEVVLQHFDQNHRNSSSLTYLRYVDDIRLFASSENDLRIALVKLDQLSKDVGLFPQASKIDIHKVTDISRELKSISNPTESSVRGKVVNQKNLIKRIVRLTPRITPSVTILDETRFKYLLAHATPTAKLNSRLLTISAARPDLAPTIARYFNRYNILPATVSRDLLLRLNINALYMHVTAEWVQVLDHKLRTSEKPRFYNALKALWKPRSISPELQAAVGRILIRDGKLTLAQTRYAIHLVTDGWVRSELVAALDRQHYGSAVLNDLNNKALRDNNPDVSLSAADRIANLGLSVDPPLATIQTSGGKALRQFGVITRVAGRACGVDWSLTRFTGRATSVRWKTIFGGGYRQAEKLAVQMRALADTNVTAFVNIADVFNDRLLDTLYRHDTSLGTYTLGNIGSVLSSPRLQAGYPDLWRLCQQIHDTRLKSNLSHPVVRRTGKPTSRIPYSYLRTAKNLYQRAIEELRVDW
jgi:hypothetical protein